MYSISSSNQKLIKPVKQFDTFEGKRQKTVEVVVPLQAQAGDFEAILYINKVQQEGEQNFQPERTSILVVL